MKTALCLFMLAGVPLMGLAQPVVKPDAQKVYHMTHHSAAGSCVTTLAEGPAFPEPAEGIARVLQLKNGNTLFVHFSQKQGVNVQLYNTARQLQDSTLAGYRASSLDAAFESGEDATLLVSDRSTKRPVLLRLRVSGETGRLLRQDTVAHLDKVNLRKRKITTSSDFLVIKDPYSESYAVWMYYNSDNPQDGGYEVVHFAADHHEISRARFSGSRDDRRFRYWDMAVIGDKMLCILGMEQNALFETASTEMKLATLDSGHVFFSFRELPFPKGMPIQGGFIKHHPYNNQLILLQAGVNEEKKTATWLSTVRLDSMIISAAAEIVPERVNLKSLEVFGPKAAYEGVPQNVIVKKDGSYTIIFEELNNHMRLVNGTPVVVSTILANVAVMDFDAAGKPLRSWMIPKKQMNPGVIMKAFYQKNRENAIEKLNWADQYKFFTYIPGSQRDYIFMNDLEENNHRLEKGKLAILRDARDAQGFYYALEGKEIIPSRDAVFDAGAKLPGPVALFAIADYDPNTGTLVTLKRTLDNRKAVQLVWLEVN
ncbi:hypothetical protein [Chitinophaga sp.]|uniref:hypothetical protein n=1 Tax=Chitinophaga sp. TaxID=1869181 RepID=UPI0031D0F0FA